MQAMDDKIHALQEEKDARNKKDAKKIKRQKVIDELSALNTTLKNDIRGLQDKTQQQSDLISSQDEKIEELNKLTKNIRRKSQLTSQNRLLASNRSKASIADLNTRIEDLTRENGVLTENLDTERQRNIVLSAQIQQYQNTLQQQRRLQQASPRRTEPAALPPPVQAPPPQMATTTATANNSGLDSKRSVFPEFIRVKRENERLNNVIRQLKKRLSDRGIKSSVAASSHSDGNFGTSHARGNSVSSRDVSHGSGIRRSFSSSQKAGEQKVRRPGSRSRQSFPRVK